jgi:hypothetical protein
MNRGALAAMVSIVVVLIAIGVYFGTKKDDDEGTETGDSKKTPTPSTPTPSSYIKRASYKCGGFNPVDVTTWFKKFIDKIDGGSDKTKYLCSSGGKYTSHCSNGGGYPGSMSVFSDEGLYEAAKAAGSGVEGSGCDGAFHKVDIEGVNGKTTVWSWGSYLDLSDIMPGEPPNSS